MLELSDFPVGAYVRVKGYDVQGRVYETHQTFHDAATHIEAYPHWYGRFAARHIHTPWVGLIIRGRVASMSYEHRYYPIDLLEIVEPFRVNNRYERVYFTSSRNRYPNEVW